MDGLVLGRETTGVNTGAWRACRPHHLVVFVSIDVHRDCFPDCHTELAEQLVVGCVHGTEAVRGFTNSLEGWYLQVGGM